LATDRLGNAIIVTLTMSCAEPGEAGVIFLAGVEVVPPEQHALPDAAHLLVLDLWSDWTVFTAFVNDSLLEEREITVSSSTNGAYAEATVRSGDYLQTVHGVRDSVEWPRPVLRGIFLEERMARPGIDIRILSPLEAWEGPASASFVISPVVGDLPDHRGGLGHVSVRPVESELRQSSFAASPS
jgi:hypothetical protein